MHVDTQEMQEVFDEYITVAKQKPGQLWKLNGITASGLSSDWAGISREQQLMSSLLDNTGGYLIHLSCIQRNLKLWPNNNEKSMKWTPSDIENSAYGLNVMFRSLRNLKTNARRPPQRFRSLEIILDKIKVENKSSEPSKSESKSQKSQKLNVNYSEVKYSIRISSSEDESHEKLAPQSVVDDVDWDKLEDIAKPSHAAAEHSQAVLGIALLILIRQTALPCVRPSARAPARRPFSRVSFCPPARPALAPKP